MHESLSTTHHDSGGTKKGLKNAGWFPDENDAPRIQADVSYPSDGAKDKKRVIIEENPWAVVKAWQIRRDFYWSVPDPKKNIGKKYPEHFFIFLPA